jgi:hypothetical protein
MGIRLSAAEAKKLGLTPPAKKRRRESLDGTSGEPAWLSQVRLVAALVSPLPSETEYRFHPTRKWAFDFAVPALKVAFEYEGIFSKKSRHTTVSGYTGDIEKYNAAAIDGWTVIRATAATMKSGTALIDLEMALWNRLTERDGAGKATDGQIGAQRIERLAKLSTHGWVLFFEVYFVK